MIIGVFGTEADRPYLPKLQAMLGVNAVKVALTPQEYLTGIYAKVRAAKLDAIICTCPETLVPLLQSQPDFRHPLDKRGLKRKLSLNDYAGSFFYLPKSKTETEHAIPVLILNPLKHLISTAEGPFVFKRFINKLLKPDAWFPQTAFSWEIWNPKNSAELLERFSGALLLSVDIETFRDDPLRRIHCVGYCALFADGSTHSVVVPFKDMLAHAFVRALNSSRAPKLFQNGLYDNLYFARFNVPCHNWLHDTQHMFHGWLAELPKRLDFITAFCVREIRYWKDDSAGGEWELFEYNAKDCWATMMTYLAMLQEVPEYARTNYIEEFPLVFPCHHVEMDGLAIDMNRFEIWKKKAEDKLAEHEAKLQKWVHKDFNPRSPDQVKRLLQALGVKNPESSDEGALEAAMFLHPFNDLVLGEIIEYRKQAKLLSTYFVEEKFWNGRLHYKINPAGTETGRLASAESSYWCGLQIQNIPGGPDVKSYIMCDDGWDSLAEGDYAQSEARCVGYLSGCKALIDLVESDKDYHSWNAAAFFGVPYEKVDKPLRTLSKRVNHGANYNMGPAVLLTTMGPKNVQEAKTLLKLPARWSALQVCAYLLSVYEKTYPEVKQDWYDDIKRTVKLTGMMVSQLGWVRKVFGDPTVHKPTLNQVVAHGPQNLSVQIINKPFYQIWRDSVYGDLKDKVRVKAQIHDSIFFAYRGEDTPEIVRKRMENPVRIKDIRGVTRTMLIPPDMSCRRKDKMGNDLGPAKYWADLK